MPYILHFEGFIFAAVTIPALAVLIVAWFFEMFKICDEYVLAAQLLARKFAISSAWLMFVVYSRLTLGDGEMNFWAVCGYILIFSELSSLLATIWRVLEKCREMKTYYCTFESNVLLAGESLTQYDFVRAARMVIEQKLTHDEYCAGYFSLKCWKFARKFGYTWEG